MAAHLVRVLCDFENIEPTTDLSLLQRVAIDRKRFNFSIVKLYLIYQALCIVLFRVLLKVLYMLTITSITYFWFSKFVAYFVASKLCIPFGRFPEVIKIQLTDLFQSLVFLHGSKLTACSNWAFKSSPGNLRKRMGNVIPVDK